jgi:O-methyltransferase
VITELERALEAGVPGDIVELGCNCGTTTIFIAKLLEQRGESRKYHAYDSFTGLPKSGPGDLGAEWPELAPGALAVDRMELARNLRQAGVLQLPNIHEAFFEDLGPVDLPDEISWTATSTSRSS